MFDFAFSEIALIGVVALVLIGPKDLPVAVKAISEVVKKLRRVAGEFQHHVDDMMRDADLADVKSTLDELRGFDVRRQVTKLVDPDSSLRRAFDDPFRDDPVKPVAADPLPEIAVPDRDAPPELATPAAVPPSGATPHHETGEGEAGEGI